MATALSVESPPLLGERVGVRGKLLCRQLACNRSYTAMEYFLTYFFTWRRNLSLVTHFLANYFQHTFDIGKHIDVCEPENFITSASQKLCSKLIFFDPLHVLSAIDLHDQFGCFTTEIDDLWRYGKLPSKLGSVDLVRSNGSPQFLLGISLIHAQVSRELS